MYCDNLMLRNCSYLQARDPSILSYNRPQLSEVKTNLADEFGETSKQQPQKDEARTINVYLRIKNGYNFEGLYEIEDNTLVSKIPQGSNFLRNAKDGDSMIRKYSFTKIFSQETDQREIFNYIVKPKILDFINGQNSTLMTYGASGSVIGTDRDPGIVPRSLEYLFRTLPQLSRKPIAKPSPTGDDVTLLNEAACKCEKQLCRSLLNASSSSLDRTHHIKIYQTMQQRLSTEPVAELEVDENVAIGVWVSFAEIYNEHVYDLLQLDPPRGQQRPKLRLGMAKGHAYIKGLTHVSVTSGEEAYQILQYGIHNLNYAPTQVNSHSSRSHSIFTIKLVQVSKSDGGSYVSCFNFCDLAGSERSKKTHNIGDRLKESNNINSSLLVLGRCISAVRNMQKQNDNKLVPFRESKLTQLFQRALNGTEDISMIVNISASRDMFDETQHVLNFAAIARDIIIEQKPEPIFKKKNRFSQLVEQSLDDTFSAHSREDLKNTIRHLTDELETQKSEYETEYQAHIQMIREKYEQALDDLEENAKIRIKKAESAVRMMYERKLEAMKTKYEKLIEEIEIQNDAAQQLEERQIDVIEIPSSDDEDEECWKTEKESYIKEIEELKSTLAEGIDDYKELHEKYVLLEKENARLRGRCLELENEIELGFQPTQKIFCESESDD
ncbi:kinesin-like protein subito isoform X2 [Zophobas morio]|uniref:kinesin-like protein subito isoform X2 n=1 Tax=Zophobas morio TaxID=2755281 RepID=UPI00308380EB